MDWLDQAIDLWNSWPYSGTVAAGAAALLGWWRSHIWKQRHAEVHGWWQSLAQQNADRVNRSGVLSGHMPSEKPTVTWPAFALEAVRLQAHVCRMLVTGIVDVYRGQEELARMAEVVRAARGNGEEPTNEAKLAKVEQALDALAGKLEQQVQEPSAPQGDAGAAASYLGDDVGPDEDPDVIPFETDGDDRQDAS